MKTTQQHIIDHGTDKIPSPEIIFRNKKSLRRRPVGLRRIILIAASSVAAAIVVCFWTLLGTHSDAPLPSATITAHKPSAPATRPVTDTLAPTSTTSATSKISTKSTTKQPRRAKHSDSKPFTPATKPVEVLEIAQVSATESPKVDVAPQVEEHKLQIETSIEPVQITVPRDPRLQPKSKPHEKSNLEQLIADVRRRPQIATNLSTRKPEKGLFKNPNLIALAEDLRDNQSENHLVELFSKKTK